MKDRKALYSERLERYAKAINLEKTDRTPVIIMADSFCARYKGVKLADFVSDLELSFQTILDTVNELGDLEGCLGFANPRMFLSLMTTVKLPGIDLPDNVMWQIVEGEFIREEDYDTILEKGWQPVMADVMTNRIKADMQVLGAAMKFAPTVKLRAQEAGYISPSSAFTRNITEFLSFGRTFPKFVKEMYKMPDKLDAVLDVIEKESLGQLRNQMRAAKENNPGPLVLGFTSPRGAGEFFTPKQWEHFIWRRIRKAADIAHEEGFVICFHIDSDWSRDLEYFTELPSKSAIFESDGITDREKFLGLLGDRMCFKGDVPAGMLSLAEPEEIYKYCTKLKEDFGPGLILSSGCTVPMNAKFENVKAIVAAASGK